MDLGPTSILYPFGNLIQRSFYEGFHVPIDHGSFLRDFLITNELLIN